MEKDVVDRSNCGISANLRLIRRVVHFFGIAVMPPHMLNASIGHSMLRFTIGGVLAKLGTD